MLNGCRKPHGTPSVPVISRAPTPSLPFPRFPHDPWVSITATVPAEGEKGSTESQADNIGCKEQLALSVF